jgi:hypothetical protein
MSAASINSIPKVKQIPLHCAQQGLAAQRRPQRQRVNAADRKNGASLAHDGGDFVQLQARREIGTLGKQ